MEISGRPYLVERREALRLLPLLEVGVRLRGVGGAHHQAQKNQLLKVVKEQVFFFFISVDILEVYVGSMGLGVQWYPVNWE